MGKQASGGNSQGNANHQERSVTTPLVVPPAQSNFDALPLGTLKRTIEGAFYRLHSLNSVTGTAWDPLHFSARGTSRSAPVGFGGPPTE